MDRNQIISSINDLFDRNKELEYQIEKQTEYYDNLYKNEDNKKVIYKMNNLQEKIYNIGLDYLFREGFSPYYSMKSYSSDKYYSFEEWIDNSINLNKFNDITKNEFINLYSTRMREKYDDKLSKAKLEDKKED